MKKPILFLTLLMSVVLSTSAWAANNDEITAPVRAYFQALNDSNKDSVMEQYSSNPVFMQQGAPAFVGRDAINQAYEHIFNILDLDVDLEILEVEQINATTAMVRTNSQGQIYIKPQDLTLKEGNNELFIVKLEGKSWKIYRYIFSNDYTR